MYNIHNLRYWEAFNFIRYTPGNHFMEHHDHGYSYNCTVSLVGYFNDDYEGRRLLFFGFGALISIFFLSLGPENRLKDTFYAYIDYFDMDKRVISHLKNDSTTFTTKAECQLGHYNITKEELLSVLDKGKVNFFIVFHSMTFHYRVISIKYFLGFMSCHIQDRKSVV